MKESMAYFSAASGLLVASFSTQESQMGQMPVMSTMADYKKFGGVLMPTKLEQQMGPQKIVVTIKDVTVTDLAPTRVSKLIQSNSSDI